MKKTNRDKNGSEKIPFFPSESASSTVIGAVLLLGIIFSIFSIVWIGYVPEWKSDAESSHMDDAYKDMADIKSKIDMMSIVMASNPNSSETNSSEPSSSFPQLLMSVPFHMGGGDVPIIGPMKSSGTLAVNNDRCKMNLSISPTDTIPDINCGTITYNSQNRYYVDQAFSYEGGALILEQNDQSVMTLYPSIRFSRTAQPDEYNVSINAVEIFQKLYAPPKIISSNKECSLRLTGIDYKLLHDNNNNVGNVSSFILTINTKHPDAWRQYLNKTIDEAGLDLKKYPLNVQSESKGVYSVSLTFPSSTEHLKRLYVSKTVVKAEPGIGLN